ncbi:hypothetical protein BC332_05150 [Capsicum chinense]|nr:hypothetical protein BC332_05150 [Capsicum chinense]
MKIPPKKPHFFKPIQKGFKHGLTIPTGFLKYLKGRDQIEHVVLRSGGKSWLVKVKGCRFKAGWAAFVEEHDLQLGDLLIFRHEGDMEFEVSIFDSSHCDREYGEYLQEEEGCDIVEETSKNFKFKGKSKLCIMSSSKEGDYMMFEVVANGEKPIWKFHRKEKKGQSVGGPSFALSNSACAPSVPARNQAYSWKFEVKDKGSLESDRDADKPNPNIVSRRKAFPNEESATHSSFGKSHFVYIVKPPYCFVSDSLVIPTKVALANGLSNKRCGLIIRDERERSWNVKLHSSGNSVYITGGWHEFRDANCLKEGDCIMFEVVSNGNTPIWKYNGKFFGNLRMPNITEATDRII